MAVRRPQLDLAPLILPCDLVVPDAHSVKRPPAVTSWTSPELVQLGLPWWQVTYVGAFQRSEDRHERNLTLTPGAGSIHSR